MQTFGPRFDLGVRLVSVGAAALLVAGTAAWAWGLQQPDPLPETIGPAFSHATHAGRLDLDCRYCHLYVERSQNAGIPSADVCMGCHRQVPVEGNALEPVRKAWDAGQPLVFNRIYDLPDFVQFRHDAHISAGVECARCHGDVRTMERIRPPRRLTMSFCLDCHRDPASTNVTKANVNCTGCHR